MSELIALKDFIGQYGRSLSRDIEKNMQPVYNPLNPEGVEVFEPMINSLLRKPLTVQKEVIRAIAKAMYKEKRRNIFVIGDMGTGKTIISLSVVNCALTTLGNAPEPARTLVLCPTHLVEKWKREVKVTIPDAKAVDLTIRNVISVLEALRHEKQKPKVHEVYVISKEKAKLSYGWRPAAVRTKRSILPHCPACGAIAIKKKDKEGDYEYLTWDELEKKKRWCANCSTPLWQADRSLKRFAPVEFIKKYLRGFFDTAIIDEIQDYKAEGSLQGRAMGAVMHSVNNVMCLTGTLNGGYADDIFHLLFRMKPKQLKADGFNYGGHMKFLEAYGTLERVKKLEDEDTTYGRGRKAGEMVRKRPGVSPVVVGKYLLDNSVFIKLADVVDGLPPYEENVVTFGMAGDQATEYSVLENKLKKAVKKYKTRALSSMLQSLLSYPDSCVLYPEQIDIKDKYGQIIEHLEAPLIEPPQGRALPKEEELISLVKKEIGENRKVLCYLTYTGTRDVRPRIKQVLERERIRVGVLDASVNPRKREEWVKVHSSDIDVLITNPELVKTGLDLYDYPTLVNYQTGYNIFTLRQAAKRSFRIGQTRPVRVYFFCYQGTMQEIALTLIAKKLEAALMVEGDLPDGLAEYAVTTGSIIQELGKALIDGGDYGGAEKAWSSFRKREIESQLGLSGKETIFVPTKEKGKVDTHTKTTITENVVVKVSFLDGKKGKKRSILEVAYGDLEKAADGRPVQFALF